MLVKRSGNARVLVLVAGVLVASALVLSGCSSPIADMPSLATPADASAPSREPTGYLPVNDLPPSRDAAAISPEERAKIEKELTAARDRQASAAAPRDSAGK
jgi:hypothetical protein